MIRALQRFFALRNSLIVALVFVIIAALVGVGWYFLFGRGIDINAAIDSCEKQGPYKEKCFDDLILSEAKRVSIAHGFDVLAAIYPRDHEFAVFCHGNTHELGALAFDEFEKGEDFPISPKSSYCGFGFYHGFLEKLVYTHGDLSEARRFCEDVDQKLSGSVSGVSFACYHGIGHGVVDGSDPTAWGNVDKYIGPGLRLCESISDVEEQKARCASGVFNALAIAFHTGTHGFAPNLKDPYVVCKQQTLPYIRKACYDQMNSYIVETTKSFPEALKSAEAHAETAYADVGISSVASYTAQNALASGDSLGTYLAACRTLKSSALQIVCAQGFAVGLIEFGDPGKEYPAAIAMCAQGGNDLITPCLRGVTLGAQDRLDPSALAGFCKEVGASAGQDQEQRCDGIISGKPL